MNIDELSQETLWKLYSFVNDGATDALPDAVNASTREKGNATDQVWTSSLQERRSKNPSSSSGRAYE